MAKYTRITYAERIRIEQLNSAGHGVRQIARILCRSASTISDELTRCTGPYRAKTAEKSAKQRAQWRKPTPKISGPLEEIILVLLYEKRFSPEQISAHLGKHYGNIELLQVCHETIYRWVYQHPMRAKLIQRLRKRRKYRRKRSKKQIRRGGIKNRVSIWERPASIEMREEPGHWEGDLIIGKGQHSCMGTLVERTTRFTVLVQLDRRDSATVCRRFIEALSHFPPHLVRSLTYDNGSEMARHELLTEELGAQVYFADPSSPWQRGTNENTNGLIREFYPKRTDLGVHSQLELAGVAALLNDRPRKVMSFSTPNEMIELYWSPPSQARCS